MHLIANESGRECAVYLCRERAYMADIFLSEVTIELMTTGNAGVDCSAGVLVEFVLSSWWFGTTSGDYVVYVSVRQPCVPIVVTPLKIQRLIDHCVLLLRG